MAKKLRISPFLVRVVGVVLGIGLLASGLFAFGYKLGSLNPQVITVKGLTNLGDADATADFGVFWQAWQLLKSEHVDGDKAKDLNMVYGATAGLVDSLKDPYTVFFTPEDGKKFLEDVSGKFGGIGAEIGIRNEQLVVVAPVKGTPAERAGLKAGHKILKVDDKVVISMPVNEAVKLIRGDPNTKVVLTIARNGWDKPKEITIIREVISVPTLDSETKESKITYTDSTGKVVTESSEFAHVKLYSFNENSVPLFYKSVIKASSDGARGMILDLRNNPGGYLEVAVALAGWFLPKDSVVVTEDFRIGKDEVFKATGNAALADFPVVVLINGGSASASEILAGALRDVRGIKLVGEKSFGKGTVQELKTLKDDSTLKLTVAKWLLPKGATIDKNGLVPDFEVKLTDEDIEAKRDPQLDKAIEVLKEEIAKKAKSL